MKKTNDTKEFKRETVALAKQPEKKIGLTAKPERVNSTRSAISYPKKGRQAMGLLFVKMIAFLFVLWGIFLASLSGIGCVLQAGSSYAGLASHGSLAFSCYLGIAQMVWACRLFDSTELANGFVKQKRLGLILGGISLLFGCIFLFFLYLKIEFMNPYILIVYLRLCVLPNLIAGLVILLISACLQRLISIPRARLSSENILGK